MHGRSRLRRWVSALLLLGLLGVIGLAATPLPVPENTHLLPRWVGPVHVVDVETGSIAYGRALRIEAGRIEDVVDAASVPPAERQGWLDAGGAYVVPGLWDMHAINLRSAPAVEYPLHLSHGVTRLRSVLSCPHEAKVSLYACQREKVAWNATVRGGRMLGPLIMSSGSFPINGPERRHPDTPEVHAAATPEQARALVELYRQGPARVDSLKTYDRLSRGSFFALAEAAREAGMEVSGHVPHAVTVREAATAGMKAIAHARVLPIACSSQEAAIVEARVAGEKATTWMQLALDTYDAERCARLWEELRSRGTFLSPTLITRLNETAEGLARLRGELQERSVPLFVGLDWREDTEEIAHRPPEEEATYTRFYRHAARLVRDANEAGVRLLVGTDTYEPLVLPGSGLHQEMALWHEAGIPPIAILRAATANAAAYHALEASHGQIRPGFVADLVFVEDNPLQRLAALRQPAMVMQEGRLYTRERLGAATERASRTARGWHLAVHLLRDFLRNPRGF
jgi:imidazolonepropionase-like amidohydrolase